MVMNKTKSRRAEYIAKHFRLQATAAGFEALWLRPDGSEFSAIRGASRSDVVRRARANWGHVNYQDEAEAFAEIFPPQYA